jgi:GNAT superfamily N-acetyltransferase
MSTILRNAAPHQLETAIAQNHCDLFLLDARIKGADIHVEEGLCWTYAGKEGNGSILFPALSGRTAKLDEVMGFYHTHSTRSLECWSLDPPETAHLDLLLLARGFRTGWKPCWMVLDLHAIRTDYSSPDGLHIVPDNQTQLHTTTGLPYAGNDSRGSTGLQHESPEQVQRFIARLNGSIVAQTLLLFGGGVAGIYNVGVVPEARGRGIGKAIVSAACIHAREKGYHYATLNANHIGRPVYEQLGFKWINNGRTWWITDNRLNIHPPGPEELALAEATGKGDIEALNSFTNSNIDLNTALCNGMRLLELAAHCKQTAAAEWLIAHGATCRALDAWDLGWKDRAQAILAKEPEEVNRLYGDYQYTLLHVAAERNDIALARLALSARPDLQITDAVHKGNPLGWAHHLHRKEIEDMIKAYIQHEERSRNSGH